MKKKPKAIRLGVIVLFLSVICSIGNPRSSSAAWSYKGPNGAVVKSMLCDVSDADTVLAGTNGGVYRTTDAGSSWNYVSFRARSIEALGDPVQCGLGIVAGAGNELFNSTDGGATWSQLAALPLQTGITSFAISSVSDGCKQYAGTWGDGVYVDGVQKLPGQSIDLLAVDANDSVYAATSDEGMAIYRSTDGGDTWPSIVNNLPESGQISSLVIDGANNVFVSMIFGGVYMSTNGGTTWVAKNTGLPQTSGDYFVSSLGRNGQGHLYAGVITAISPLKGRIYKSVDDGSSWQATPQVTDDLYMDDNAMCAAVDDTIYAGAQHGLFKISDGGESWSDLTGNISAVPFESSAFAMGTAGALFIGSDGDSVYKSMDQGETWSLTGPDNPVGCSSLIALGSGDLLCAEEDGPGGLFRSANNGLAWTPSSSGLPSDSFNGIVVYQRGRLAMDGNGAVYIGLEEDKRIYKSTDGGVSWSITQAFPSGDSEITALVGGPNGTVYAGVRGWGIYKTTDSGATWIQKNNGFLGNLEVREDALFIDNSTGDIYAGLWDGLYRSSDGGDNWSYITVPSCGGADQVTMDEDGNLYAIVCQSEVHVSQNQGVTWHDFSAGLPADPGGTGIEKARLSRIYADGNGSILLSAASGGIYKTEAYGTFNPVDFDQDGQVLDDIILILRMLAGLNPEQGQLGTESDINNDGRVGLPEVEYAMQWAVGLR